MFTLHINMQLRWIPQPIRDMGKTVNDVIDTLRGLFRRDKRAAQEG